MKRVSKSFIFVFAFVFALAAALVVTSSSSSAATTKIKWNGTPKRIVVGKTVNPKNWLTVSPSSASKRLVFTTSNKKIVKVQSGKLVGVKAGTAYVRAKDSKTGSSLKMKVVVEKATSIKWNNVAKKIYVGDKVNPTKYLTISPSSVKSRLTYTSKKSSIVKVQNGQLVGVKAGTTYFVVKDPVQNVSKQFKIVVKKKTVEPTSISAIGFRIHKGNTKKISATVEPSNATVKYSYEVVSGSSYVSVDSNGKVTAKARGTAKVKITATGEKTSVSKTITVKVADEMTKVTWKTASSNKVELKLTDFSWTDDESFVNKMQAIVSDVKSSSSVEVQLTIGGKTYNYNVQNGTITDANGNKVNRNDVIGKTNTATITIKFPVKWMTTVLSKLSKQGSTLEYNGLTASAVNYAGFGFVFGSTNKVTIMDMTTDTTFKTYEYFISSDGELYFEGDVTNDAVMKDRLANVASDKCLFSKLTYGWYVL